MKDNPEDTDSPIWTADDFAKARPATEMLPPHLARLLVRERSAAFAIAAISQQHNWARGLRLAA